MPSLAGALTGLGLLALPAVPSPTYHPAITGSADTWSVTATEATSVVTTSVSTTDTWSVTATEDPSTITGATPITSGVDTWAASWADTSALTTYPEELTQLGALGIAKYVAVTSKGVSGVNVVGTSDTWSAQWNEDPLSQDFLDTWDTWLVKSTDVSSVSVSQTFAANDIWAVSSADVSSLAIGAPVLVTPSDTWSASLTDSSGLAATADTTDTWSATWTEAASDVTVSQTSVTASDTWSVTSSETSLVTTVVQIPLIADDQWLITLGDVSALFVQTPPPPPTAAQRRLRMTVPSRR